MTVKNRPLAQICLILGISCQALYMTSAHFMYSVAYNITCLLSQMPQSIYTVSTVFAQSPKLCTSLWCGIGLRSTPADPLTPPADQYCPIWPLLFLATIPAESAPLPPALLFRSPRWDRPGTVVPAAKSDSFKERPSVTTHYTQYDPWLCVCIKMFPSSIYSHMVTSYCISEHKTKSKALRY